MKKTVVLFLGAVLAFSGTKSFATPVLSDSFSYPNGALVGQGGWAQTSTSTNNPIQVNGGAVTLTNTGQDAYDAFTTPVTLADGQSLYFGLTIDVTAAQSGGDYFLHFTPDAGDSSLFYGRVFAKSTTGGYLIGVEGTAGGGAAVTYGTQVLTLGTSYQFVLAYNFSATTPSNSVDTIYINPTDPVVVGNDTAYVTAAWGSANADTNTIAAVNFRQGSSSVAPTVIVDNLNVSETFADAVPEPATLTLMAVGGAAALVAFRRRR
jgi:hypothetical protein